jgi:hypothetical protein
VLAAAPAPVTRAVGVRVELWRRVERRRGRGESHGLELHRGSFWKVRGGVWKRWRVWAVLDRQLGTETVYNGCAVLVFGSLFINRGTRIIRKDIHAVAAYTARLLVQLAGVSGPGSQIGFPQKKQSVS